MEATAPSSELYDHRLLHEQREVIKDHREETLSWGDSHRARLQEPSTTKANSIDNDAVQELTEYTTPTQEDTGTHRLQRENAPEPSTIKTNSVQELTQCRTAALESVGTHSLQREHASELSTIKADSINNDAIQELTQWRNAAQENTGIHRLQREREPELRLLFQQPDVNTVRINVTAAQEIRLNSGAEPSLLDRVLGVTHSKAELRCSLEANHIKVTMFFVPLKDDMVVFNDTSHMLFLEKMPQGGFDSRSLPPKHYEIIYPGFWRLYDNKTSVEFLLRPCRYQLFLTTEVNKRLAGEDLPPPKRGMLSTGAAATGATGVPPARDQKTIVRRELANADLLNGTGLDEGQALHLVNRLTGQREFSIKFIRRYQKNSKPVDVFKAIWDECSKSRVVAVKQHRITTAGPLGVVAAVENWERELKAHKDLDHVRCPLNLRPIVGRPS